MAISCVYTSPLDLFTVVGLLDVVRISNSAKFKSFLLIIRVKRMLFELDPLILRNFWPTFTGTSLLPFRLVLRPILNMLDFLRKIDEDFGGSISWHTQPNWRVIFNMPLHFVTFLLNFFAKLFINPAVCKRALFSKAVSAFGLIEQALWDMQSFFGVKDLGDSFSCVDFARLSIWSVVSILHAYRFSPGHCNCLF